MDCPVDKSSNRPAPQSLEVVTNNGQITNDKANSVAETALNSSVEHNATTLETKNITSVNAIQGQETIALSKEPITFRLFQVPFGEIAHTMPEAIFNKDFYRKVIVYIQNDKEKPPIINSEADVRCIEYVAFQALSKAQFPTFAKLAILLREQKPDLHLTKLMTLYQLYMMIDYTRESYEFFGTHFNKLDSHERKHPYHKEMQMLALDIAQHKEEAETEIRLFFNLALLNDPDLKLDSDLTFANNVHRPDFVRLWIDLMPKKELLTPLDKQMHQICLSVAEKKWEDAIRITEQLMKDSPRNSTYALGKVYSLLKLNRIKECEKFVRKMTPSDLFDALISVHKKEKQAFKFFKDHFSVPGKSRVTFFWVYLELCQLIRDFPNEPCPKVLIYALQEAASKKPHYLEIHETLLNVLLKSTEKEAESKKDLARKILKFTNSCTSLNPTKSCTYFLNAAKKINQLGSDCKEVYLELIKKAKPCFMPETQQAALRLNVSEILAYAKLLSHIQENEANFEVLLNYYALTQDDNVACEYALQQKNKNTAITFLIKHCNTDRVSFSTLYLLPVLLFEEKRYEEALVYAIRANNLDNEEKQLQSLIGMIYFHLKDYGSALKFLAKKNFTHHGPQHLISYFQSCLHCNELKKATAVFEKRKSDLPEELIVNYERLIAQETEENETAQETEENETAPEMKKDKPESSTSKEEIKDHSSTHTPLIPVAKATSITNSPPPVVTKYEKKQKPHYQSSSKHSADVLNPKKKLEDWKANPSLLSNACTIDSELYGFGSKPAAAPAVAEDRTEVVLNKRLTEVEHKRLERARQHLIQIGDLLSQEKERTTPNPEDPGNFLFPRTLMYNVLKFCEALAPTGRNQHEISDEFKQIVQTHIISTKLILALRQAMRHDSQKVDIEKLKVVCQALKNSTVLKNIEAYQDCPDKKGLLDKSEAKVYFYDRAKIQKKQDIKTDRKVDYLAEAQMELERMHKIGGKLSAQAIDSEIFYKEGLKMALCNIEESLKRLNLPDDPELREIFYYGNRFAHEMGSDVDPTLYYNEEIQIERLYRIVTKADKIRDCILRLVKK